MRAPTLLFLSLVLVSSLSFAAGVMQWNATYGGDGNEYAASVQQTSDGGYIAAGYTDSFGAGGLDFWVVKTNPAGGQEWNATYGGAGWEWPNSIKQTADGGYIIAGYTNSFGAGNDDFWLVKINSTGGEQWNKTFGGSDNDEAYSVQQTSDGGYIVAGTTASFGAGSYDFWLIKTDPTGAEQWNATYGGANQDDAFSVQQTSDGGYVVAGHTYSFGAGNDDFWLVKTNSTGAQQWNATYGGADGDQANSVQQTTDGGYIVAGSTYSFGAGNGADDFWLVKANSTGGEQWNATFGGGDYDEAYSAQQTSDGNYVVVGRTYSFGFGSGSSDAWLIKTNTSGGELWNVTYGGAGADEAYSIQQTADGGYILGGLTNSFGAGGIDMWLVKVYNDSMINSCPLINSPGNYQLVNNLVGAPNDPTGTFAGEKTCVLVKASNVDFNCNGFGIANNGTPDWVLGVLLDDGLTNVTVRNCHNISDYTEGILISMSNNSVFTNNVVQNFHYCGIRMFNSSNNTVSGNVARDAPTANIGGIWAYYDSDFNVINNNTVYNATNGIVVSYYTDNNMVSNNIAYGNPRNGFSLSSYSSDGSDNNNIFANNTAFNNSMNGFSIRAFTNNNSLINNTAYLNGQTGFNTSSGSNSSALYGNTAYNNPYGFYLDSSTNNTLANNTAYNNSQYGLYITNSNATSAANTHFYNDKLGEFYISTDATPRTVYLYNMTIDNPSGNFANCTSLNITDTVEANTAYQIKWGTNSSALPANRTPFMQKFINITAATGAVSIDSITWNWQNSELTGYDKTKFALWKYNATSNWTNTNATLNTSANTLTLASMNPGSVYGILENTLPPPIYSNFDGQTTDFITFPDYQHVSKPVIEQVSHGIVKWSSTDTDVAGANFNLYVLLGNGSVSVDSSHLNPTLNSSANVTLYGLPYQYTPLLYSDGALCTSGCTILSYASHNLAFSVPHFTNYSAGPNTNLAIYDQYEGSNVSKLTPITFYANYTNATDNSHVAGATCLISFDDATSGTMVDTGSQYNYTKAAGFATTGIHLWNVTCNKTGYETLFAQDSVTVGPLNLSGNLTSLYQATVNASAALPRFVYNGSGNLSSEGGNITGSNIYTEQLTDRWAAFYGNITGSIILTDKEGANNVYQWGWTPTDGGVVCTSTNSSVTDLKLYPADGDDIDAAWGFAPSEADSGRNTFNQTGCGLTIGTTPITNAGYADTGPAGGFVTCSLKAEIPATKPDMFFCTNITQNGVFWNNETGDFELMVPTAFGNNVYETYYFYVNLD